MRRRILFDADPGIDDAMALCRRFGIDAPVAEAHVHCDPHTADAVFGAAWPVTVVGLDATHQVLMGSAYLDALGDEGGAPGPLPARHHPSLRTFLPPAHQRRHLRARCQRGGLCAGRFALPGAARRAARGHRRAGDGPTLLSPQGRQQACVGVDAAGVLADFRACVVR